MPVAMMTASADVKLALLASMAVANRSAPKTRVIEPAFAVTVNVTVLCGASSLPALSVAKNPSVWAPSSEVVTAASSPGTTTGASSSSMQITSRTPLTASPAPAGSVAVTVMAAVPP